NFDMIFYHILFRNEKYLHINIFHKMSAEPKETFTIYCCSYDKDAENFEDMLRDGDEDYEYKIARNYRLEENNLEDFSPKYREFYFIRSFERQVLYFFPEIFPKKFSYISF